MGKEFCLKSENNDFYGYVGEKTLFKDCNGKELFVGDVIKLEDEDDKYYLNRDNYFVVNDGEKPFIMGIKDSCHVDGTISGWKVHKVKSYKDLEYDVDVYDGITFYKNEEENKMKKSDLKFGNVARIRDGRLCLIEPIRNYNKYKHIPINYEDGVTLRNIKTAESISSLCSYKNDLRNDNLLIPFAENYDIMQIYEDYTLKKLLWERKEIELSEKEIEVLKALKLLGFIMIARNSGAEYVFAYKEGKIEKQALRWVFTSGANSTNLNRFKNLFQFVKWEDEKPYSIDELLGSEEKNG